MNTVSVALLKGLVFTSEIDLEVIHYSGYNTETHNVYVDAFANNMGSTPTNKNTNSVTHNHSSVGGELMQQRLERICVHGLFAFLLVSFFMSRRH